MNLKKKKQLASKTLRVGINRIAFNDLRKDEIKEAITKQDIRDLHKDGAITIKEVGGRKKIKRRKTRRKTGKIKKKVRKRKQNYVKLVRKLRKYLKELKKQDKLDRETYRDLRKKSRSKVFKSKRQLKAHMEKK